MRQYYIMYMRCGDKSAADIAEKLGIEPKEG
jgi:hypothetical protein